MERADLNDAALISYQNRLQIDRLENLLNARRLYLESGSRRGVTNAGWLLFGRVPPIWSYIRYVRYSGSTVETGVRLETLEDTRLEGTIPALIQQARDLLVNRLQVTRLTPSGQFGPVLILPEFAWLEAIVNAVTHRSYSLQGDGVRVLDYADRLEVHSPGRLPGLVRVQNIRSTRFSRNPHIARVLAEDTGYVRELNEGVRRMFQEMVQAGLRPPVFTIHESSVQVTLYKKPGLDPALADAVAPLTRRIGQVATLKLLIYLKLIGEATPREMTEFLGVSQPTARNYLALLEKAGLVERISASATDPSQILRPSKSPLWGSVPGPQRYVEEIINNDNADA